MTFSEGKNQLYRNNGNGIFTEVGEELGVALDKAYTITEGREVEEGIVYLVDTPPNPSAPFDFAISPNPNFGQFNLEFYTQNENPVFIEIYNSTGQLLFSKEIDGRNGENIVPIEMNILNHQVVMVRVFNDELTKTKCCLTCNY